MAESRLVSPRLSRAGSLSELPVLLGFYDPRIFSLVCRCEYKRDIMIFKAMGEGADTGKMRGEGS